ncbi:MAG: LysM peptidoglycan-binding domain-containing protein [Gammaproteobacteria bacterium]|nr:LysM peptidoglycan-binding domain-containing protein [Gammaproteobacteria bacterium]
MDAKKLLTVTLLALVLAACGTVPIPVSKSTPGKSTITKVSEPGDQAPATSDKAVATKVAPAVPQRTPKQHITEAIKALQVGKVDKAKRELEAAIRQEPSNVTALNLLVQINTPASKYFAGKGSFRYKVKSGESLSTIAKKYLKEPLKFYILAKYNNIENPSKVKIGQSIRIPGVPEIVKLPPKKKKTAATSTTDETKLRLALARRLYESGKYQEAIDHLESLEDTGPYVSKRRDLLVLTYAQYANVLTEKAELLEAEAVLEKAVSMEPKNRKLKNQLARIRNQRKASTLYNTGLQALNEGNQDKAYEAFSKVLELNPKHEMARRKVTEMKSEVIESLHKSAMQHYRKQELDKAIGIWDKVLEMDPDHELAKLYRARAIGLKKRFDKL